MEILKKDFTKEIVTCVSSFYAKLYNFKNCTDAISGQGKRCTLLLLLLITKAFLDSVDEASSDFKDCAI